MKYQNIHKAVFLNRPNRFIAECELNGESVAAHVKNTGRCRELLVPGAIVYLDEPQGRERKT
jgi:sugar fermentation stimulation protein A